MKIVALSSQSSQLIFLILLITFPCLIISASLELRGANYTALGFTDTQNLVVLHSDSSSYLCTRLPLSLQSRDQFCITSSGNMNIETLYATPFAYSEFDVKTLYYGNMQQWYLFKVETFDDGLQSWVNGTLSTCNNRQVLKSAMCSSKAITKVYKNIPPHTYIRITMLVDFLDRWKGENLSVYVNGAVAQQLGHDWCKKAFQHLCNQNGIKVCGVPDYPDRIGTKIMAELENSDSQITISVSASFDDSTCLDASWALESIQIELK